MLTQTQLDYLNSKLLNEFGRFMTTNHPLYRVIWSHDQFEKRWTQHDRNGFELAYPVVKELPKYRQWADNRYILERCMPVPAFATTDLVEPFSYEPLWTFKDRQDPRFDICKYIIDLIHTQAAKAVGVKYKDPLAGLNSEELKEAKKVEIDGIYQELFGNETDIGDALAYKEGIVVPRNFEKDN